MPLYSMSVLNKFILISETPLFDFNQNDSFKKDSPLDDRTEPTILRENAPPQCQYHQSCSTQRGRNV